MVRTWQASHRDTVLLCFHLLLGPFLPFLSLFFCGLRKTPVSMKLCQEGRENKVWGCGVWEFVGVRKSAVVSSYYMKSLDVELLGLRRENMKAADSYSFLRLSPTNRMASMEPFTLVLRVSRPHHSNNFTVCFQTGWHEIQYVANSDPAIQNGIPSDQAKSLFYLSSVAVAHLLQGLMCCVFYRPWL